MESPLIAGAAATDITPHSRQFLHGYPHVSRYSTGVHDPIFCSALFLSSGGESLLFVACDVIFVDRRLVAQARARIEESTGVPANNVLVSATHTHSGPITVDMLSNAGDLTVPEADAAYLKFLEDGIVRAAVAAVGNSFPAQLGLAIADGSCVGGNRHDPNGPSDPATPVLAIRDKSRQTLAALLVICSMHPTVLHEDSTRVSADFPGMTRQYLQEHLLGANHPVIYHTGPCGNLSPRHITRSNTFEEAKRLGMLLGQSIQKAVASMDFVDEATLHCSRLFVDLPIRDFLSTLDAELVVKRATEELSKLRQEGADPRSIRTAECKCFGAEETLTLSRAAEAGDIEDAIASTLPAEIMAVRVGPWKFVGWPGEQFVEYSLELKAKHPNCYIISLANGELQGYLVTEDAVRQQTYEALNALFASPQSGRILLESTTQLLSSDGFGGEAKSLTQQ